MNDKAELRKEFITLRDSFDDDYKTKSDADIAERLFLTDEYINSPELLIYVSVKSEVDTSEIINQAFADGKKIAVPHCRNGIMSFFYISSTDELVCSQFGVPTVDVSKSEIASPRKNSLCIVPALTFDSEGNRLGYGGGYYDRFLSANQVNAIGLCREKSLCNSLPAEEYDIKIQTVITENSVIRRRVNIGK